MNIEMSCYPFEYRPHFFPYNIRPNLCYENCGAILYGSKFNPEFRQFLLGKGITLYYVLGMLSTEKEKDLPHAWLLAQNGGSSAYYDPTLQEYYHFDNKGINNFSYDLVSILSIDEIDRWFIDNYPDRKITPSGLPEGNILFPIINKNRQIIKTPG